MSTVFLGLDHNFSGKGPPILFESWIDGGPYDGFIFRYPTLGHAKAGHWEIVDALKEDRRPTPSNAQESVFNGAFWDLLQEMFEDDDADWWKRS